MRTYRQIMVTTALCAGMLVSSIDASAVNKRAAKAQAKWEYYVQATDGRFYILTSLEAVNLGERLIAVPANAKAREAVKRFKGETVKVGRKKGIVKKLSNQEDTEPVKPNPALDTFQRCGPKNEGRVDADGSCRMPGGIFFQACSGDPASNCARRRAIRNCTIKSPDKPYVYSGTDTAWAVQNLDARLNQQYERQNLCCADPDLMETGDFRKCRVLGYDESFIPAPGTTDPADQVDCGGNECIDPANGLKNGTCGAKIGDNVALVQLSAQTKVFSQLCCSGTAVVVGSIPAYKDPFARGQPILAQCIPNSAVK